MTIGILLALIGGGTVIANRMMGAQLSARLGLWQSTLYNYVTGLITALIVLAIARQSLILPGGLPIYLFFGGLIGVLTVTLSIYCAPHLSALLLTLLAFSCQFVFGLALDALRGVAMPPLRIGGGLLVLLGLCVYVLGERD